jgi:NAD(P)-dependent dehydrogenase (short-subunit alcohol dehydrogenase family)
MPSDVVVIIGSGGIGQAIARRQGAGRTILLADRSEPVLAAAREALEADGHAVCTQLAEVSSRESVRALAQAAAGLGAVVNVVNTAGLTPQQAPPATILAVNLVGTALVLQEFEDVIAPAGAGLVISSMAAHGAPPLGEETARLLGQTPADELLALPVLSAQALPDSGAAFAISKQASHARAQAAALSWGERGARVNCISPGVIATPLVRKEMSGPGAENYRKMIAASVVGRIGTVDEVATAAAFLLGPDAGFITGADLLIDGGAIAALRAGRLNLSSR